MAKIISINAVVDIVGALAAGNMSGSIYLFDTNKVNGSKGLGTEHLQTAVREGNELVWSAVPLECEAYVAIERIEIDPNICEARKEFYKGTDVSYWIGRIKRKDFARVPYKLYFQLGSRSRVMTTASPLFLIGEGHVEHAAQP